MKSCQKLSSCGLFFIHLLGMEAEIARILLVSNVAPGAWRDETKRVNLALFVPVLLRRRLLHLQRLTSNSPFWLFSSSSHAQSEHPPDIGL
ncbi:hypothetical protein BDP55DRAFT_139863 [Colletotrichum godetiae]|uniref:Secreted protein n=1 Tax=Colletotrichum godetiae TaxID=1209918 RepID=A0AAJ0AYK8_9PEZI|nr:uncharacterized protein BDP55DRAFT_139863 [Colletotrichum godetiae]KAK1700689.1 hypothetical protein BDP55DRAFT_139863 [Colletotrichum godetiae]